ncbi:MAG: anti-sigma factor [Anaerocolumna sp.]|jgi:uncharacterized membrane protein|nr:anti-sigma factor [Anaerocolumna sp.]
MSEILKCDIVRDLLPSYMEGLTSNATNEHIKAHLASCMECNNIAEKMRAPVETNMETKEMDYLKKIKQRSKSNLVAGIFLTALLILALLGIRFYIVGFQSEGTVNYKVMLSEVQSKEEAHLLIIQGTLESHSLVYTNNHITTDGDVAVITLSERLAFPWEDNNEFYIGYEIPDGINIVYLDNKVIWENGIIVSEYANELYQTKHAYIGDMSANGKVANTLDIVEKFGNFKNSLQTTTEPYGWTLEFEDIITKEEAFNNSMTKYSYVMLSLIDNLGELSWKYNNGNELVTWTVTVQDATKAMKQEIKNYSKSISQLQSLLNELYLN